MSIETQTSVAKEFEQNEEKGTCVTTVHVKVYKYFQYAKKKNQRGRGHCIKWRTVGDAIQAVALEIQATSPHVKYSVGQL